MSCSWQWNISNTEQQGTIGLGYVHQFNVYKLPAIIVIIFFSATNFRDKTGSKNDLIKRGLVTTSFVLVTIPPPFQYW